MHRRAAREHRPTCVDDERVAVEHQLVLPADLVHVRDRDLVVGGAGGEHALALARLARVERRGVDVDDHLGAVERGVVGGAVGVPDVLAHRDRHLDTADEEARRLAAGMEVALLVEDPVVGEAVLAVARDDRALVDDGGAVVEHAVELHASDDERREPRGVTSEGRERGLRLVDERRANQQVLGWVAGYGQLGEGDDIGVERGGAARGVEDARAVAVEVTDGGVDLGESHPQMPHPDSVPRESVRGTRTPRLGSYAMPSRCRNAAPHASSCRRRPSEGDTLSS